VTVNVYPTPSALFQAVPTLIYIPDNEVAFLNRSTGAIRYDWDFGDGETSTEFLPSHLYTRPGLFDITLKVENEQGCTDEYTVPGAVKAEQGGEMSFPNAFTPNTSGPLDGQYEFGDRRNQVFYPSVQKGIVEYRLQIFSRWGELLFQSDKLTKGWDGYYKNKLCPQGVYIWRVRARFSNGHISNRAGDITLLR
jgi:gliding motility-associated-like protein